MPPVSLIAQHTGFNLKQKQLARAWDKTLGSLLSDGTVDIIYKRWTGQTLTEIFDEFGNSPSTIR
jgi:ABC-type amino acid transport substrate-binding protein